MTTIETIDTSQNFQTLNFNLGHLPEHFPVEFFLRTLGDERQEQREKVDILLNWLSWQSMRDFIDAARGKEILGMRNVWPKTCASIETMLKDSAVDKQVPVKWYWQINSAGNLLYKISQGEIRTLFKEDIELFLQAFTLAHRICEACASDLSAWQEVYEKESKEVVFRAKTSLSVKPANFVESLRELSEYCTGLAKFFGDTQRHMLWRLRAS